MRLRLAPDGRELLHQLLVDVEAAGGVEDHDVAPVGLGALDAVVHGLDRIAALVGVDRHADLLAELDELVDRRGTLQVGGDERRLLALLREQERELAGGGGLARALQACEEDRGGRPLREGEAGVGRAEEVRELLVHDLHDLLARREALLHVLAQRALAHPRDELLDDAEVDVGLEQREAHLAHGAGDRLLVEDTAPAEVAEGALELVAERVEHRPPGYPDGL